MNKYITCYDKCQPYIGRVPKFVNSIEDNRSCNFHLFQLNN